MSIKAGNSQKMNEFTECEGSTKAVEDRPASRMVTFGRRRSKPCVQESADSRVSDIDCTKCLEELNTYIAMFRDFIMHIGKPQDCAEMRDKIRETRNRCVDLCVSANEMLMPQIRSDVSEGIPVDSQQLVNLVCCTQLLLRELAKCYNLIKAHPMDMTAYYVERRPRSSGVAVLDMLVLWRPPPQDYHQEELHCIIRDSEKADNLLKEMKEFMPVETPGKALIHENMYRKIETGKGGLYRQFSTWLCFCRSDFG